MVRFSLHSFSCSSPLLFLLLCPPLFLLLLLLFLVRLVLRLSEFPFFVLFPFCAALSDDTTRSPRTRADLLLILAYLLLGTIERGSGDYHAASSWFKRGMTVDKRNVPAMTLLAST